MIIIVYILNYNNSYKKNMDNIETERIFQKNFNELYNFLFDFWKKFESWLKITKLKIDWFRENIWEKKKTIENIQKSYNEVKQIIDTASWTIQNTKNIITNIDEIKQIIDTSTWNIEKTLNNEIIELSNTWEIN